MDLHLVQYDIAWEDKDANFRQIDTMIDQIGPASGGFIVMPELGDVGFSRNLEIVCDDRSERWASSLASRTGCWVQHGWARQDAQGRGHNLSGIFAPDGRMIGAACKLHPFTFASEHTAYDAGDALNLFRGVGSATVCPLICYDLRFPEAFRCATRAGAEVFTVTASWPSRRADHWRALCIARAIDNQAVVAACNRIGTDPFLEYHGGSIIVGPKGEVLAESGDEACVLSAQVDPAIVTNWRATFPILSDMRDDLLGSPTVNVFDAS